MLKILSVQIYDFEKYGHTFRWVLFHDFRAIVFEHVLLLFGSLNVRRRLTTKGGALGRCFYTRIHDQLN